MAKKSTVKITSKEKNNWKEAFTTITPVSKAIAFALFITLPLLAFLIGVKITKKNMRWMCQTEQTKSEWKRSQLEKWD